MYLGWLMPHLPCYTLIQGLCFIHLPIVIANKFIMQAAASVKMPVKKQAILSLHLSGTLKTLMVPQLELQMLISS